MKRCGLVIAVLAVSLWAFAQTGQSSGASGAASGTQSTPAAGATAGMQPQAGMTGGTAGVQPQAGIGGATTPVPASTVGATGFSTPILNTGTGTVFVNAPPSQPSLVAPIAHLGTAAPVVGATNATPGNIAGAVSSTLSAIPSMAPVPLVSEIANPVPVIMVGEQGGASPLAQSSSGLTISGTINPGVAFNTGVGSFSGGYPVGTLAANQTSLGEIAREFRSRRANEQARTFTNQDVQRMNQTGGGLGAGGGTSGAVTSAPGTMTQPVGNAPAMAQPGNMNAPAVPGVATPVPPQPQSNQPPPMSQMQAGANPTEMAQAPPPSGVQEAPAAPVGTQRSERGQLPRAASVLPLMALVGFLAAAAGLLAR